MTNYCVGPKSWSEERIKWLLLFKDQARLYYDVPVGGLDAQSNEITCNQQISMTVVDAINSQRKANEHLNAKLDPQHKQSEYDLLFDYLVINYAYWDNNHNSSIGIPVTELSKRISTT